MDTETYKTIMQEALNVIEKAKEAVRKAEEDARNLYDKQAHELTEKYSDLVGKIVDCKNCAYSGVGIYCVRNSWTEPFRMEVASILARNDRCQQSDVVIF